MNTIEMNERTEKIIKSMTDQFTEAMKAGEEQAEHFLVSTAYMLCSIIPGAVHPQSIGPMTMLIIDALSNGLQTGMEVTKVQGAMVVIKERR